MAHHSSTLTTLKIEEVKYAASANIGLSLFFPNCQVFDDLEKMLSVTTEMPEAVDRKTSVFPASPVVQLTVGLCVALTSIGLGMYAL